MDFEPTEDQRQLRDVLARIVEREYGPLQWREHQRSAEGFGRRPWRLLAEAGVLALPLPEREGGLGGSPAELAIVMEAIGKGLMLEPVLASVVTAGGLVADRGDPAQRQALLPSLADGSRIATAALHEPGRRHALEPHLTRATADGQGWRLDGCKALVPHGGQADWMVIPAHDTAAAGGDRARLFVVPRDAAGLAVRDYATADGARAADLVLDGVRVSADAQLGEPAGTQAAIERIADVTTAALCMQAIGVMDRLCALTFEHLRTRRQFGQPIGRFQALAHRAADMSMQTEMCRSLAWVAALSCDDPQPATRRRAVSAAKSLIGRYGRRIAQASAQLHGGMGVTEDLEATRYAKWLTLVDYRFGDADHHAARFEADTGTPVGSGVAPTRP